MLPVNGIVESQVAILDGGAHRRAPARTVPRGDAVRSGTTNAGDALDLRATPPAAESAYAAIVRLVQEAGARRAPFIRWPTATPCYFLAVALALAAIAWAASGDPSRPGRARRRDPVPLILAAPVALVSGVSRAARAASSSRGRR